MKVIEDVMKKFEMKWDNDNKLFMKNLLFQQESATCHILND